MFYVVCLFLLVLFIKDRATQIFSFCLAAYLCVFNIVQSSLLSFGLDFFELNAMSCLIISTLAYILKDYRFAVICVTHLCLSVLIYSATEYSSMLEYAQYSQEVSTLVVINTLMYPVKNKKENIWFALIASLLYLLLPKGLYL